MHPISMRRRWETASQETTAYSVASNLCFSSWSGKDTGGEAGKFEDGICFARATEMAFKESSGQDPSSGLLS